jgi:hypothetical protein
MTFGLCGGIIADCRGNSLFPFTILPWRGFTSSAEFILGTAALIAGICIGLFAIIGALGLLIAALRDKAGMQRTSKDQV